MNVSPEQIEFLDIDELPSSRRRLPVVAVLGQAAIAALSWKGLAVLLTYIGVTEIIGLVKSWSDNDHTYRMALLEQTTTHHNACLQKITPLSPDQIAECNKIVL